MNILLRVSKKLLLHLRSNYGAMLSSNLLMLVSAMIGSIILARLLGPTGRGEIAIIVLWPQLLVNIGKLGTPQATLYYAAKKDCDTDAIYGNAVMISLLQSTILIVLGYYLLPFVLVSQNGTVIALAQFSLLLIPFALLGEHSNNLLQAKLKIRTFGTLRLIIPVGNTLLVLVLLSFNNVTVTNIAILRLLPYLVVFAISLYFLITYRLVSNLKSDFTLLVKMLVYGIKITPGVVFLAFNLRFDQVVLVALVSPAMLGIYVVAVTVSEVSAAFAAAISSVLTPIIAKHNDILQARDVLVTIFQKYWLISNILKIGYTFVVIWGIPIVFGLDFGPAVPIAVLLLLASVFKDASLILRSSVQGLGRPWIASQAEIIAAIVTFIFLVLLVPVTGILGAAITSIIAYGTSLLFLIYNLNRLYQIGFYELFRTDLSYSYIKSILRDFTNKNKDEIAQ